MIKKLDKLNYIAEDIMSIKIAKQLVEKHGYKRASKIGSGITYKISNAVELIKNSDMVTVTDETVNAKLEVKHTELATELNEIVEEIILLVD